MQFKVTIEHVGEPKAPPLVQEVQQFSRRRYHEEQRIIQWSPFNQTSNLANKH